MKNTLEYRIYYMNKDKFAHFISKNNFKKFETKGLISYWAAPNADIIMAYENKNIAWRYIHRDTPGDEKTAASIVRINDRTVRVHTIIANLFCYNPYKDDEFVEVRHRDGCIRNNAADNLEWISRKARVTQYYSDKNIMED